MAQHRYQVSDGDCRAWAGGPGAGGEGGMWALVRPLPSLPSVQVSNLGQRDLPVSISFLVPVELNQVSVWTELEIFSPQVLEDCVAPPRMPFTWISCVPQESLMSPLRCLLSVFSQNPSIRCSSERIAPTESNFRTFIQKNSVLVRRTLAVPHLKPHIRETEFRNPCDIRWVSAEQLS